MLTGVCSLTMMCKWLENVRVCTLCRGDPHKRPEPAIMNFVTRREGFAR